VVEPEDEVEFDLTILQDQEKEDRAPESMEDPVEQADVIWQEDPWAEQTAEPEEFIIEISEPSGCHQVDKKGAFWKLFVLLLIMYSLGGVFGYLAGQRNKE